MQNVLVKLNKLFALFFLASSLSCIAFDVNSCMSQDDSYDVPLGLFNCLVSTASNNGLLPMYYGVSELLIQDAQIAFVPYLMSYIPDGPEPIVRVSKKDIGRFMLSFFESQKNFRQQQNYLKLRSEMGFNDENRPHVFSIEDDCGPEQIADWMLDQRG